MAKKLKGIEKKNLKIKSELLKRHLISLEEDKGYGTIINILEKSIRQQNFEWEGLDKVNQIKELLKYNFLDIKIALYIELLSNVVLELSKKTELKQMEEILKIIRNLFTFYIWYNQIRVNPTKESLESIYSPMEWYHAIKVLKLIYTWEGLSDARNVFIFRYSHNDIIRTFDNKWSLSSSLAYYELYEENKMKLGLYNDDNSTIESQLCRKLSSPTFISIRVKDLRHRRATQQLDSYIRLNFPKYNYVRMQYLRHEQSFKPQKKTLIARAKTHGPEKVKWTKIPKINQSKKTLSRINMVKSFYFKISSSYLKAVTAIIAKYVKFKNLEKIEERLEEIKKVTNIALKDEKANEYYALALSNAIVGYAEAKRFEKMEEKLEESRKLFEDNPNNEKIRRYYVSALANAIWFYSRKQEFNEINKKLSELRTIYYTTVKNH